MTDEEIVAWLGHTDGCRIDPCRTCDRAFQVAQMLAGTDPRGRWSPRELLNDYPMPPTVTDSGAGIGFARRLTEPAECGWAA